jgi:hypothetical protein
LRPNLELSNRVHLGIVVNLAGRLANHFVSIVSLSCLYLLRESGKLNQLMTSLVIL